ncbi:MAG: lamin tail domain-containing protein [Candidatus Heimdallarchaeota archaeon]|nr:lamin tail domain-containing protein [Candidatus Heimdallarchaeota archaeon]
MITTKRSSIDAISTTTFKGTYNITTFVGPDNAFKVVIDSIRAATTSFYLEVYTLSSEALVNELIAAKVRLVDVVVQLSERRLNSYENDYTNESAWRLNDAGIDVSWIQASQFTYTHSKFWIVDSQIAYVYSGNWAPSSIPQSTNARTNREMGFAFNDASIAAYFEDVFFDDGAHYSTPYSSSPHIGYLQSEETGTYVSQVNATTFIEYAEVTPIFSPDNSYELLSSLIENATSTIDLELQYIKFDCELLYDLIDAALSGVSIRVLIPEPVSATENVTEILINNGIQIKFFKGMTDHNKYVSVDNEIVQVSSINWSNNSVVNNRESGAIVKNANIAAYFKKVFDFDWANSETPVGFTQPVALVSPKPGGIASGSFNFQASFAVNTYTSGELLIDATSIHIWTDPIGIVSTSVDTTSYSDGVHTVKVIGTPTIGSPIEIEKEVNIVNDDDWLLLISEVRYDGDAEPNGEYAEIYNGFSFSLSIEGWMLTDNEGEYVIPEGAQIASGEVLVFAQDSATFVSEMSALGITVSAADYGLGNLALGNTGDEVILKDSGGYVKDAVAWGSGVASGTTSWSGSATGEDETLQRVPANEDTNDCNTDFIIDTPSPGTVEAPTDPGPTSISFLIAIVGLFGLTIIFYLKKKK